MSKLKVTQVRSAIGKPQDQRQTLAGLGLKKLRKTVERSVKSMSSK